MGTRRLRDLGESGLLAELFPRLPAAAGTLVGPGDDAAVLTAPDGRVVVTTDVLVEARDFRREWSSAADVGWKAATANLADVAAMGAVPTALVVALAAPPDLAVDWAVGLTDGIGAACRRAGAGVVGGDLSAADTVMVAITALGDLRGRRPVRRDGAAAGDVVALAGRVGGSAAGLALLQADLAAAEPALVAEHRRPQPPLDAGPLAAAAGATAMLDVSDGLVTDLTRLLTASGVDADLDTGWCAEQTARLLGAARVLGGDSDLAEGWLLTGGEDHALLACFPPGDLPAGFTRVGTVGERSGDRPRVRAGSRDLTSWGGWDHFG